MKCQVVYVQGVYSIFSKGLPVEYQSPAFLGEKLKQVLSCHVPPLVNRQRETTETITFPQLRWPTVTMFESLNRYIWKLCPEQACWSRCGSPLSIRYERWRHVILSPSFYHVQLQMRLKRLHTYSTISLFNDNLFFLNESTYLCSNTHVGKRLAVVLTIYTPPANVSHPR